VSAPQSKQQQRMSASKSFSFIILYFTELLLGYKQHSIVVGFSLSRSLSLKHTYTLDMCAAAAAIMVHAVVQEMIIAAEPSNLF
jgi:hypothetical protein